MSTTNEPGAPQPGDDIPQLKQYTVELSLNHFVGNMTDRATRIAQVLTTRQSLAADLHPDLAPHLQRVAELAQQLQAELDEIAKIDPDAFNKLKQL